MKKRIYYGWWIVLAGVGIGALASGLFHYGFSAFFIPWRKQFGWSRASLGGVIGFARLEGGIAAPIAGWFVDNFGPRKMMLLGIGMMGLGFIVLSQVTTIIQLYLAFLLLLALGSSFGTYRPLQVAVANWFMLKRGRAMGLLMAGSGLGGSFVFLFAMLIENRGWEEAAIIAGLLMWCIGLPLTLVIRHKPEEMGLTIDGEDVFKVSSSSSKVEEIQSKPKIHRFWQKDERPEPDLSLMQALRTQSFWVLALTYAIWAAMPGITTVHIAPFLAEELNLDYVTALGALSFFVAASIIGRVGFGFISDYFNIRILLSILFLFQGLGIFLFSEVQSLSVVPFYVVIFAIPYGGTIPLRAVAQGYFFGKKNFGTIGGFLQIVDLPATVSAPIWVGWLADTLPDGYRLGFKIVAFSMILAAVAILLARRPTEPFPEDKVPNFFKMFSGGK
jgi:sugar phosphate permease